jgi:NADH-quinone oxidoreductase subunit D
MRQAYIPSEAVATHVERTEEGTMIINMGPQHPSTHGVLRVVCELEGERIVKAECVIGYLHTGMEKEAEYLTYHKALPMTDRMDYLSANNNNLAFSLSIEKILGVEIPPRGQYLRVILAELSRLASHLVWIGTHAMDLGAMTIFFYAFREREKILDLFEMMSGVRMMPSWICPGGLRGDMPDGFEDRLRQLLKELPRAIDDIEGMLTQNPIWRERTMGVGALTTEECFALGVSGPNIRATGFAWDIRKSNPYSGYEQFEFNIPVGARGDVYDRYLVRMAEMRESLKILQQAIDGLPSGPINTSDLKVAPPPREAIDASMESLIHWFKIHTEGFRPPVGEAYVPIESPKGELGFYFVSDGTNRPYRMHTRAPSFMNLQALEKMAVGRLIADMVALIGSIDIVLGEIDR